MRHPARGVVERLLEPPDRSPAASIRAGGPASMKASGLSGTQLGVRPTHTAPCTPDYAAGGQLRSWAGRQHARSAAVDGVAQLAQQMRTLCRAPSPGGRPAPVPSANSTDHRGRSASFPDVERVDTAERARALGGVHRDISARLITNASGRQVRLVLTSATAMPTLGRSKHLLAVDQRTARRRPPRHPLRDQAANRSEPALEQERKLVAAQPRHRVPRLRATCSQALDRRCTNTLSAAGMAHDCR